MDIAVIAAAVAIVGGIFTIYFGVTKNNRSREADAERDGSLRSDIGYIKGGIDDLKRKQEEHDKRYFELQGRVSKVEALTQQAHKRIDGLEGKK